MIGKGAGNSFSMKVLSIMERHSQRAGTERRVCTHAASVTLHVIPCWHMSAGVIHHNTGAVLGSTCSAPLPNVVGRLLNMHALGLLLVYPYPDVHNHPTCSTRSCLSSASSAWARASALCLSLSSRVPSPSASWRRRAATCAWM
jgi:hypothetical protein